MRRSLGVLTLGICLALVAGCSGDDGDGGPSKPCPAKGIGVGEIGDWENYNCSEPQICPDKGWVAVFDYPVDPANPKRALSVILTNCSKGQQKLVIEKVVVKGDDRCYMSEAEVEDKEILPGSLNARFVRVTWKPEAAGRDDAALEIHSNAKNFPVLEIPLCGTAIAPSGDAGVVIPDKGAWTQDAAPPWARCNPVTKLNSKCHTDPIP
jgi:hypothetical protein